MQHRADWKHLAIAMNGNVHGEESVRLHHVKLLDYTKHLLNFGHESSDDVRVGRVAKTAFVLKGVYAVGSGYLVRRSRFKALAGVT